MDVIQQAGQAYGYSPRATLREWRMAKQLAAARREIDALVKALEEAEAERDAVAKTADCALELLSELVAWEWPPLFSWMFKSASGFLAAHYGREERVGERIDG